MKRNFIFVLVAALLLAPWPVVYAYDGVNADSAASMVTPADPALAPQMKPFGNAVGKVSPGDLFQIDTTGLQADTSFELVIANVDELISNYRFMNFKIGIYVRVGNDAWQPFSASDTLQDIYISMHGGRTDFTLPAGAQYRISVEKGCFYCNGIAAGMTAAIPVFYISSL